MELMFITNDAEIAKNAEDAGVDIIFIDLEINGKYERQGHLDTHISDHKFEDIGKVKSVISKCKILARINPYNEKTRNEVDMCIEQGAEIIMLPMFKERQEVERFIKLVNGRAEVCLLLETPQAMVRINDIIDLEGIDRVHIGLNDLHLGLGLNFMFELLGEGIVEYLGKIILNRGIKFGFGGIARIGEGAVPAEIILGEHYRLKSQMVILSRDFRNKQVNIENEISKIRKVEESIIRWSQDDYMRNSLMLKEKVRGIAIR